MLTLYDILYALYIYILQKLTIFKRVIGDIFTLDDPQLVRKMNRMEGGRKRDRVDANVERSHNYSDYQPETIRAYNIGMPPLESKPYYYRYKDTDYRKRVDDILRRNIPQTTTPQITTPQTTTPQTAIVQTTKKKTVKQTPPQIDEYHQKYISPDPIQIIESYNNGYSPDLYKESLASGGKQENDTTAGLLYPFPTAQKKRMGKCYDPGADAGAVRNDIVLAIDDIEEVIRENKPMETSYNFTFQHIDFNLWLHKKQDEKKPMIEFSMKIDEIDRLKFHCWPFSSYINAETWSNKGVVKYMYAGAVATLGLQYEADQMIEISLCSEVDNLVGEYSRWLDNRVKIAKEPTSLLRLTELAVGKLIRDEMFTFKQKCELIASIGRYDVALLPQLLVNSTAVDIFRMGRNLGSLKDLFYFKKYKIFPHIQMEIVNIVIRKLVDERCYIRFFAIFTMGCEVYYTATGDLPILFKKMIQMLYAIVSVCMQSECKEFETLGNKIVEMIAENSKHQLLSDMRLWNTCTNFMSSCVFDAITSEVELHMLQHQEKKRKRDELIEQELAKIDEELTYGSGNECDVTDEDEEFSETEECMSDGVNENIVVVM